MPSESKIQRFIPDYAIPPGITLLEILEAVGLSQADLAERAGRPKKTINEIVKAKAAITADTALQFERVLGVQASFWIGLEQNYRAALARAEERVRLAASVNWISNFPVKELISRGWIEDKDDKVDLLQEVLRFFGVASPEAWDGVWKEAHEANALRQSATRSRDFGGLAAWLRWGEIRGRERDCAQFNAMRFRQSLQKIRRFTREEINSAYKQTMQECASAGVAVVLVPELPKLGVYGATRWLSPEKALIQLSLHYKRDDQFWFSFFHEAAHILLHRKRGIFVEQAGLTENEEREADAFAANTLIPAEMYASFISKADYSKAAIARFSENAGISQSIVVGRLQHDRVIGFSEKNDLHVSLRWANVATKNR
jgi:HTH-type transcriptional regulator/antitoxin HigA